MTSPLQPVILSGGAGSRLWPLSREHYPKQLLPLVSQKTLIQETACRLEGMPLAGEIMPPLVICNENHRFLIAEQLKALDKTVLRLILEPVGRNTAPALTLAAFAALRFGDHKDPILLAMPADHVITDLAVFQQAVLQAWQFAQQGKIVTFGIVPNTPATAYGYLHKGTKSLSASASLPQQAFPLLAFVEKPSREKATQYLASGHYLWNSGIFILRAALWLELMEKHQPEMLQYCRLAFEQGQEDTDFYRINPQHFKLCPSDSIDYAIMEKITTAQDNAQNLAVVIPLEAGWSDIGAWASLHQALPQDKAGNVTKGDVYMKDCHNTLTFAEKRMVAAIGLENITIVETADAVLVVNNQHAEQVKQVVDYLKQQQREEHLTHLQVFRPWGSYERIDCGDRYQVKRINVKPGASLSLQKHHHRAEHWIVVKGTAKVVRGDEEFLLTENQSTYIPLGVKHRLENPGTIPLDMIEVQSGSYLGEDDIVRFEDNYGRTC